MKHSDLRDNLGYVFVVCFLVSLWFWIGVGIHRLPENENQRKSQQNELLV